MLPMTKMARTANTAIMMAVKEEELKNKRL